MRTVKLETAIADFLELGRRLQEDQPLTGQRVLDELSAWYIALRVENAALDEDADMLLLQWGATRLLTVVGPTDLRKPRDDDLKFADRKVQYLDFTRQVFSGCDDDEAEFDDAAVQMSITLGFSPADGTEINSNQWIYTPDHVDAGKKEFLSVPFVRSLITLPAGTITVTVDHCG